MKSHHLDDVAAPPTISGAHGRAWAIDLASARKVKGVDPRDDATLAGWIVEAPWAHLAWHSYFIALVHLRPLPDARKTIFYFPDASHEFWVYALDPSRPRQPAIVGAEMPAFLTPCNFATQRKHGSDTEALAEIERAVKDIVDGRLSPDTDFLAEWSRRYGNFMIKGETAKHHGQIQ